jgi:DnaK suppressor protein
VNEPVLERIGSSAAEELGQVEAAIRHLDAGLYGRCSVCRGAIEPARLAAVPYAITCSRCA